jgi:4-diphosphocytidyl-2-C-methyl-D-erythritol kinase
MRMMRGIGDVLGEPLAPARFFAVLVNPGVSVETAGVFKHLGLQPGQDHRAHKPTFNHSGNSAAPLDAIASSGNDLEAAAIAIAPVIEAALNQLRGLPGCRVARMSGSGATVFGLFDDCVRAASGAKAISREQPGWWVRATVLR